MSHNKLQTYNKIRKNEIDCLYFIFNLNILWIVLRIISSFEFCIYKIIGELSLSFRGILNKKIQLKQITFSVNFIFLFLFCCEVKFLTFLFSGFFFHMRRESFCCREFFAVAFFLLFLNSTLLIFNFILSSALMIVSNSRSLWNGSQLSVSLWCSASMCGCQVNVRA